MSQHCYCHINDLHFVFPSYLLLNN